MNRWLMVTISALGAGLAGAGPALAAEPTLDKGDTAWMLTSTALVLMMTIPGVALFYGGMVRKKNVLSVLMQVFAICCVVSLVWMVAGYSLAFTDGGPYLGDLSKMFLAGIGRESLSGTMPESVFMMFQMTFAIITPALIVGAFVDRMKFGAMLLFTILWSLLVYSPIAHWVWAVNTGFLARDGVLDFAGGTVVHINAGIAGLVTCLVLGQRIGYRTEPMAPHNLVLTVTGASLLWVGWFGFNAGSAVNAGSLASSAFAATHFAAAAAALGWAAMEWVLKGKPSVLGCASGMVAGLATITPASGFVTVPSALQIGLAAGVICYFAVSKLKAKFGYDDSLDVFGVHGVGSTIGMLMLGFLASGDVNAAIVSTYVEAGKPVALVGGLGQFMNQAKGVLFTMALAATATFVIFKLVDALVGLRVSEEEEVAGLDLSQHGEAAYNEYSAV